MCQGWGVGRWAGGRAQAMGSHRLRLRWPEAQPGVPRDPWR